MDDASASGGETEILVASLRAELAADPTDAETAARLGDAYYQRSRETADSAFYVPAEEAYEQALANDPRSVAAITGQATLALVRHDFATGLALAERAREIEPDLLAPYPPLIDGRIELGRYEQAAAAIGELLKLKPGLAAYTRLSYFEELHGNESAALRAMRLAAGAGLPGTEAGAFPVSLLGDLYFRDGRYGDAADAYERALAGLPDYRSAEVGLLDVTAARGRVREAIEGYRGLVEQEELTEYADELGRLEQAAGLDADADRHYAILSKLHQQELAAGQTADAGQVIFEADHGDAEFGLELGERVWEASPSVSSADAYSWVLLAAGKTEEAAKLSRKAMRLGTEIPQFRYHAGMIAAANGEDARARRLLGGLLSETPRFDPLFAPRAERKLAELG
ncbi:MAG: tetratricopeptide repeat protein [Solirubrobacterales bacterium]